MSNENDGAGEPLQCDGDSTECGGVKMRGQFVEEAACIFEVKSHKLRAHRTLTEVEGVEIRQEKMQGGPAFRTYSVIVEHGHVCLPFAHLIEIAMAYCLRCRPRVRRSLNIFLPRLHLHHHHCS